MRHGAKAQAAVDFMVSYGIALIVIFIAVSVIYKITFLSPALATQTCTTTAGFACEAFILNRSAILTLQLSQATGGTITIDGAACYSQVNSTGNKPAYGNIWVTNTPAYYYGTNSPRTGINLYSGSSNTMIFYCYAGNSKATGVLGNGFTGFIWLNYTVPGYGNLTQQVAQINVKYT
jgi:hypothetical protein